MTRLLTTVAASALVLGLGAPSVLAQTTTTTTTQTQTQTQAPAPAPAPSQTVHHRRWEHSAQWQADHSANDLNRQEVARIESNTAYGSSR